MSNNGKRDLQSQTDVNLNRFAWRTRREIPIDIESLEFLINKKKQLVDEVLEELLDEGTTSHNKREEMLQQLFVAAAKILTDVQYQFFTAYHVLGMSETQIAESFGVTQPYISIVLSASARKIRKHLKIE